MHVVIAGLYGLTVWFALLGFTLIVRADWVLVLWLGPFIVSGAMVFIWAMDLLIWRAIPALCARVARLWKA